MFPIAVAFEFDELRVLSLTDVVYYLIHIDHCEDRYGAIIIITIEQSLQMITKTIEVCARIFMCGFSAAAPTVNLFNLFHAAFWLQHGEDFSLFSFR